MAADDEAAREEPPLGLTVAHLETAYHQTHIAVYGSEAAELAGTSYLQREDIEMNPADVSVQRLALRFTREVREVLDAFWQAALMHERVYHMKHSGNTQLPTALARGDCARLAVSARLRNRRWIVWWRRCCGCGRACCDQHLERAR